MDKCWAGELIVSEFLDEHGWEHREMVREIARLRELIRQVEFDGREWDPRDDSHVLHVCPWCSSEEKDGHDKRCRAFNQDGIVRFGEP